jgi:hypothetical protein
MLQGLTVNGSKVKNDSKIMRYVHCVLNIYFVNDWWNLNKWFNQMNISFDHGLPKMWQSYFTIRWEKCTKWLILSSSWISIIIWFL